jgi:hypothetical protein
MDTGSCGVVHISTISTKKEEKKQKKKERTATTNLNSPHGCVDERELFR